MVPILVFRTIVMVGEASYYGPNKIIATLFWKLVKSFNCWIRWTMDHTNDLFFFLKRKSDSQNSKIWHKPSLTPVLTASHPTPLTSGLPEHWHLSVVHIEHIDTHWLRWRWHHVWVSLCYISVKRNNFKKKITAHNSPAVVAGV